MIINQNQCDGSRYTQGNLSTIYLFICNYVSWGEKLRFVDFSENNVFYGFNFYQFVYN